MDRADGQSRAILDGPAPEMGPKPMSAFHNKAKWKIQRRPGFGTSSQHVAS